MRILKKNALKFLILLCLVSTPLGSAKAQDYIFDLLGKTPKLLKTWQNIVPSEFKRQRWIYHLDGTTTPIDIVEYQGKQFYRGWICIRHNCGGNELTFLISKDGKTAYGLINSTKLEINDRFLGDPDLEGKKYLMDKMN